MTTAPPPPDTTAGRTPRDAPAPVDRRVLAGLIDCALLGALWLLLIGAARLAGTTGTTVMLVTAVVVALPRELVLAWTGGSLGGRLTRLRLVAAGTGGPPRTRLAPHAALLFLTLIPTLGLGAIPLMRAAARDPHRQAWHDRVAGVQVVSVDSVAKGPADSESPDDVAAFQAPLPSNRADDLFPDDRFAFSTNEDTAETASTFETARVEDMAARSRRAIIDSVPWSAIPTRVDSPTMDSPVNPVTASPPWYTRTVDPILPVSPMSAALPARADADIPLAAAPASGQDTMNPTRPTPAALPSSPPPTPPPPPRGTSPVPLTPRVTPEPGPVAHPLNPVSTVSASAPRHTRAVSPSHPDGVAGTADSAPQRTHAVSPTSPIGIASTASTAASVPRRTHAGVPTDSDTSSRTDRARSAQASSPRATRMSRRRAAAPQVQVRLVPLIGGEPIPLTGPTVLGRDPQNISDYPQAHSVAISDVTRSVSKTHAAVAPVSGGAWVTDLHSTNGTRIETDDGVEIATPQVPVPAPAGSVVVFGRAAYRIEA